MFDAHLLLQPQSRPESPGRLLVLELRNRAAEQCRLPELQIELRPGTSSERPQNVLPDPREPVAGFNDPSRMIAPGEVVHLLLAWSSAPLVVKPFALQNCAAYDGMTVAIGSPPYREPFLEVRHFWTQSCGPAWRSPYRRGTYALGEGIDEEWLHRADLKASDFAPVLVPRELPVGSSEGGLRRLNDVEYLPGTFESGYFGYFELYLKMPPTPEADCSFQVLRKREADGQTLIYINHCPVAGSVPRRSGAQESRLWVTQLGMLPQRTGVVEYDEDSEILAQGDVASVRSHTELHIRDPKQPMVPVIDSSTPECKASQLIMTSPPAELGTHWRNPREYAPSGQVWYDGKVFEFTNTSATMCRLGGAPELRFLNAPEIKSGSLRPPIYRNCSTPIFQTRDSRWIDLRPNDSAHFIAARHVFDPSYSFLCTVMGGLALSLPGENEPLKLPFEAGTCAGFFATNWREGRYDSDPLNLQYDKLQQEHDAQRAAGAPPVPEKCRETISEDTGRPVMFPSGGGLVWGLSTRPASYGDKLLAVLWLYNATDKPLPVWTCMGIDAFWAEKIDVFDAVGHRILSRGEQKDREQHGASGDAFYSRIVCSRNFPIDIPPHACVHGTFSQPAYDFARDLQSYYDLPPGKYLLVPRSVEPKQGVLIPEKHPEAAVGLPITVNEP